MSGAFLSRLPSEEVWQWLDQESIAYQSRLPKQHQISKGHYFTPAALCDFMLGMGVRQTSDRILEPSCGSGVFLLRAYDMLSSLYTQETDVSPLNALFGVELDAKAAVISFCQLLRMENARQVETSLAVLPNILQGDFLAELPGEYGQFDAVIGNPPYVRQEHLAQLEATTKATLLEPLIAAYSKYLRQFPEQKTLFRQTGDLYLWFFLKSALLLKPGGRLVFVTSNSWLNTDFGKGFQRYLHHHFRILGVLESCCEQWFDTAAVNPVILVLERREKVLEASAQVYTESQVVFARLQKPLKEILPKSETGSIYWQKIEEICRRTLSVEKVSWAEKRVRNQLEIVDEGLGARRYNWAFYLRAPQLLDTILQESSERWSRLQDLGKVRYPLKTGINQFFYVDSSVVERFGIEPEFLVPVVKSSKGIHRYQVIPEQLERFLFSCPWSLKDLKLRGKQGALDYIHWGATQSSPPRQKRMHRVPWPEVPSVQGRTHWYKLEALTPPQILSLRFFDQRFFFPVCEGSMVEDQTFYGVTLTPQKADAAARKMLVAALLNSTVSYLLVEFLGRTNLGDGVLQFSLDDMMRLPVINPENFSLETAVSLVDAFQSMMQRDILPIEHELLQSDRRHLDRLVLAELTGSRNDVQERLYFHLLQRIDERRSLSGKRYQR